MKYIILMPFLLCASLLFAQDLEEIFTSDFEKDEMSKFHFTDPKAWTQENGALALLGKSDYTPPFRSPFNIAILKEHVIGDFTLEVDLKQTGREYGHRDMCIFFGINDPTNFYYVHIASVTDDHAHNIFIVNDEARKKISTETTNGVDWGDTWNRIKVERNTTSGEILIYFNDMNKAIMKAKDFHFPSGYIGFGSFDDTGLIDNIKLEGKPAKLQEGFF